MWPDRGSGNEARLWRRLPIHGTGSSNFYQLTSRSQTLSSPYPALSFVLLYLTLGCRYLKSPPTKNSSNVYESRRQTRSSRCIRMRRSWRMLCEKVIRRNWKRWILVRSLWCVVALCDCLGAGIFSIDATECAVLIMMSTCLLDVVVWSPSVRDVERRVSTRGLV